MNLPLIIVAHLLNASGIPVVGDYVINDIRERGWITWWWTLVLIWSLIPFSMWTTDYTKAHRMTQAEVTSQRVNQ